MIKSKNINIVICCEYDSNNSVEELNQQFLFGLMQLVKQVEKDPMSVGKADDSNLRVRVMHEHS